MKTKRKPKPKPAPSWPRIDDGDRVIALDVSSTAAGWAIGQSLNGKITIEKFGLVKPPSHWKSARRIAKITEDIGLLCEDYDQNLILNSQESLRVVMEWQSHMRAAGARSINGLATLGQAQGSAWWNLRNLEFMVDHVSEREWTKERHWPVSKVNRAAKIRMLVPEYAQYVKDDPSLDSGLDIADALGILIWRLTR